MHVIIIHATYMSSVNSMYSSHDSTKYLYSLTYRAYKDHMAVINITSYNGSKLGLSTDNINKWLREALFNIQALPRGTRMLSRTILSFRKTPPSGSGVSHLKI